MSVHEALLQRHSRLAIFIDRLQTIWTPCVLDDMNNDYRPIDEELQNELIGELEWLQKLLGAAIVNEGDVRSFVIPPAPAKAAPPAPPPADPPPPPGPRLVTTPKGKH